MAAVLALIMSAFSLLSGLLVIYATQYLGYTDHHAHTLFATFSTLTTITPALGGYLCGRYIGYARGLALGLSLASLGLYMLCFHMTPYFHFGLAMFSLGAGISASCGYAMLGRLLKTQPAKQESGFILAYSYFTAGALLGLIFASYIAQYWSFTLVFFIAATALVGTLLLFLINLRDFPRRQDKPPQKLHIGLATLFAALIAADMMLHYAYYRSYIFIVVVALLVLLIAKISRKTSSTQRHTASLLGLFCFGAMFWAVYLIIPSMMASFVKFNMGHALFGYALTDELLANIKPLLVVAFGLIFAYAWPHLKKQFPWLTVGSAIATGVVLFTIAFVLFAIAYKQSEIHGLINPGWILAGYTFLTLSEILIIPIGYAYLSASSEKMNEGLVMGMWLTLYGVGGVVSGFFSATTKTHYSIPKNSFPSLLTSHQFMAFDTFLLALIITAILIAPRLYLTVSSSDSSAKKQA